MDRDITIARELSLTLHFVLETHIRADHITGGSLIKDGIGARIVYGGGAEGVVSGADLFRKSCVSVIPY